MGKKKIPIEIEFIGRDRSNPLNIEYEIKKSGSTQAVLPKTTFLTDLSHVLRIANFEIEMSEDSESLDIFNVTYSINGSPGIVKFDLKTWTEGKTLKITQNSLTVEIHCKNNKGSGEPFKNKVVSCELATKGSAPFIKRLPQRKINENGVFTIEGVELTDSEEMDLSYEINTETEDSVKGKVTISAGNSTKEGKLVIEQILTLDVEIYLKAKGENGEPVKNKGISWVLGDAKGTTNSGELGKFSLNDLIIGQLETKTLNYTIEIDPKNSLKSSVELAHNDETKAGKPLIITQYFLIDVQINFLGEGKSVDPVKNKDVKWETKVLGSGNYRNEPTITPTDVNGVLHLKDIFLAEKESLSLIYEINGIKNSLSLNKTEETKKGNPLVFDQYLGGVTLKIPFKGCNGKNELFKGKEVTWKILDIQTSKKTGKTPINNNAELIVDGIELPEGKNLKFEYEILGLAEGRAIKGNFNFRQTDETRKGNPIEMVQYVALDVQFKFLDLGADSQPIKNREFKWKLKSGKNQLWEKTISTNRDGELIIEDIIVGSVERLSLSYSIEQISRDNIPIAHNPSTRVGKPLTSVQEIELTEKALDKQRKFVNPNRAWLTYETNYNWTPYAKTNQKFDLRLYRTDLTKLLVILASEKDLDAETLTVLKKVFFPEIPEKSLREYGVPPWDGQRKKFFDTPKDSIGSRDKIIAYDIYANLPYNLRDNDLDSNAIGTKTESKVQKLPLKPLDKTLDMWNTASRSSIVHVDASRVEGAKEIAPMAPPFLWQGYGARVGDEYLGPNAEGTTQFNLSDGGATFHQKYFSVKTGVDIIGYHIQGGKVGKDRLEHNTILAVLRSAYIRELERLHKIDSFHDTELLVLTEILTVTEADPRWDDWMFPSEGGSRGKQPSFGDGFQIRSLKGLEPDKEYFPPTSIPFVTIKDKKIDKDSTFSVNYNRTTAATSFPAFMSRGMPIAKGVYNQAEDENWQEFWKIHYAEPLGRTKARLLLSYGLQGFGGNAQNFLLEMNDGLPNGRIVVRDMGDYALHDFILWALFGPGDGAAPDPRQSKPKEQEKFVQLWKENFGPDTPLKKLIHYECNVLHELLSSDGTSEFPTFTGYHRSKVTEMHTFNPFCECCFNAQEDDAKFVGHISPLFTYAMPISAARTCEFFTDVKARTWLKVLQVQAQWGMAHARAWVRYIESALEINFKINWQTLPIEEFIKFPNWRKTGKVEELAGRMFNPQAFEDYVKDNLTDDFSIEDLNLKNLEVLKALSVKWEDLNTKFKTWEMYIGWQVENFIQSAEGQQAIRDFRDRGWKPVTPKFKLKVLDSKGLPIEKFPLRLKRGDYETQWSDLTDAEGVVPIYRYSPDDCQVNLPEYDDVYVEVKTIKDWTEYSKEVIFERLGGEVARVQFIQG